MAIPEAQLERWAHQGAITTSSSTYRSIRTALESPQSLIYGKGASILLQGSYGNDTNIYADSDVDVVVQLHAVWHGDVSALSSQESARYQATYSDATYRWQNFYNDVVQTLRQYYGTHLVDTSGKAIKVLPVNGRLGVDVIAAIDYRIYFSFQSDDINSKIVGIQFCIPSAGNRVVYNYPEQQKQNNIRKHQLTSEWYKPTVRIFKNMRNCLIEQGYISEQIAPSYFVEGLIYNVPNTHFGLSYQQTIKNALQWLISDALFSQLLCQNERLALIGNSSEQWSESNAQQFINACVDLWNAWSSR